MSKLEKEKLESASEREKNHRTAYDTYMKQLQSWTYQHEMNKWLQYQYFTLQSFSHMQSSLFYLQQTRNQVPGTNTAPQIPSHQTPQATQQVNGHTSDRPSAYRLPSLGRRAAAETIDFFLLFSLKMMFLWSVMLTTGTMAKDLTFQILFLDDFELDKEIIVEDELHFMLGAALVYRCLACLYEFYCIRFHGYTVGKKLLGLEVIQCRGITRVAGTLDVQIFPGTRVCAASAWARSGLKNLSIAFLIPAFMTAYFYPYKRTSYDIVSNTIVVERDHST